MPALRVAHRPRQLAARTRRARCAAGVEVRRRRALDHLLVAPLHRAVALEQVHELAVAVAQDLHLDVPRALRPASPGRPRRCRRRPPPRGAPTGSCVFELVLVVDDPHAAPAAAPARLEHQRIADLGRQSRGTRPRRAGSGGGGRHHRHAGRRGSVARRHLVAERRITSGVGPTKAMPARAHGSRELGVLRQEAVARDGWHRRRARARDAG